MSTYFVFDLSFAIEYWNFFIRRWLRHLHQLLDLRSTRQTPKLCRSSRKSRRRRTTVSNAFVNAYLHICTGDEKDRCSLSTWPTFWTGPATHSLWGHSTGPRRATGRTTISTKVSHSLPHHQLAWEVTHTPRLPPQRSRFILLLRDGELL